MSKFQVIDLANSTPIDWVLPATDGPVTVPDAHLLFSGTFRRQGSDLLIEGDGKRALLPEYFNHEHAPALFSPDGAMLDAATVRALSGHGSQWQYAQAGGAAGPAEIGTVRTLVGTATAARAGASQQLAVGQPVFQGDVLETGANSSLGITLIDRTVFSLSASARMVMNELVYDPARNDNSMAVSLVQGSFVFITGQVAKTGTLSVTTPVATMGIRGTTPIVKLSTTDGSGEFSLGLDPGGIAGSYVLTSLITGQQIASISSTDIVVRIQSSSGPFDIALKTPSDQTLDLQLLGPAYQVFQLLGQRGDAPTDGNKSGKGQGGVEFAYNPQAFDDLHASQLLGDTRIGADNRSAGPDERGLFDILRQLNNPTGVAIDLDVTSPGINRAVTFAENGAAVPVSTSTQITVPVGVTELSGATIVLQNASQGDTMSVGTLPGGIKFTITPGSIHVNLTGEASVADYIAAIQAISFDNASDNPSTDVRIIEVTVTTINGDTATAFTLIAVQSINDPPVNHLPAAQSPAEDTVLVFSTAKGNAITVTDVDAGTQPITVTLSVQHGKLTIAAASGVEVTGNNSAMLVVTGSQDAINHALDGLAYTPPREFNGTDAITVSTTDNGASGAGGPLTTTSSGLGITVTAVNDAPQGTDKAIVANEDQAVILTVADFGFSDPHDTPANMLLAVKITTLPGNGSLTLDGHAVALGAFVAATDIAANLLVWTPGHDAHGDGLASLTFQVQDNGGTANGGIDLDPTARTLTFDVTEVNDAPRGTSTTLTTNEDHAVTLQVADFGFTDPHDTPANMLLAVKITTVPGKGLLTLDGHPVMAGDFVSAAAIAAEKLVWTPGDDQHGTGLASLTFQVQDNGGTANGGIDLDPTPRTLTFNVGEVNDAPHGANKTIVGDEDHAVTLHTTDFGFSDPHDGLANSLLAVRIATLPGHGELTLNGVAVMTGASVSVADINSNLLVWTPGDDEHGNALASFTFQVQDNGGTANGGVDLDPTPRTLTFNVGEVNDAPHGANKTIVSDEDHAVTLHTTDFSFTDPHDGSANGLLAVRIATLPGDGALKLQGHLVTAGTLVSADDISAGKLVWTPGDDEHGNALASFTFQVQDNGGTANGGVDLDPTPRTLTFNVGEVNDAPVARGDSYVVAEDGTLKIGAAGVLANDSDIDSTVLSAMLVQGPQHGSLLLNADGSFIYHPTGDYNGSDSFTYKANDGTASSGVATVRFSISPEDDAPMSRGDSYVVAEDGTLKIGAAAGVLANDSDIDSTVLSAILVQGPQHGALTLNGDGSFTYHPTGDYNGSDSFTYKANDGTADSGVATVRLSIARTDEGDDHSSSNSGSGGAGDTFNGVGSAVEVVDFSSAASAHTTTVAFGADAPLDSRYAVDILRHFDNAERQLDLSAILDSGVGRGAVNGGNLHDYVVAHATGGGKIAVTVDVDGPQGAAAPFQVASISGTAAHGDHALAAGDVIAVIFDHAQPAAQVTIH